MAECSEPVHQEKVKRPEPGEHREDCGVEAVSRNQEPAAHASVPRQQHQRQFEIVDCAEAGQIAEHQQCEPAPVLGKHPRRIALPARPVRILSGIQVAMRRNEIWPRQNSLGGQVIEPPAAEQPVVYAVMHQNEQGVLPRADERNRHHVCDEAEVPVA